MICVLNANYCIQVLVAIFPLHKMDPKHSMEYSCINVYNAMGGLRLK